LSSHAVAPAARIAQPCFIMNKLYEILCYLASFQLLLFAVFLFIRSQGKAISNKMLGLFFLAKGIAIIDTIVRFNNEFVFTNAPGLFFIAGSFDFLFGPTLYLYVKSVVFTKFTLKKTDLIHLVPFVSYLAFFITTYHMYSPDVQRELITSGFFDTVFMNYVLWSVFHGLVLLYMILILRLLLIYGGEIRNNYSNLKTINLAWLKIVMGGFVCMWSFYLINHMLYIFGFTMSTVLNLCGKLTLVGFSSFLILRVLAHPTIIPGIGTIKGTNKIGCKTIRQDDLEKLTSYMKTEKPYLEPNLAIQELAERTSISRRRLSYIINTEFNKNFFDFINEYRINEAKTLLAGPESSKKTILEILYEVGFNSKSVFNSIFKKQTGHTPSQFKKNFLISN
jgi:AraC-like DNA-binding protein